MWSKTIVIVLFSHLKVCFKAFANFCEWSFFRRSIPLFLGPGSLSVLDILNFICHGCREQLRVLSCSVLTTYFFYDAGCKSITPCSLSNLVLVGGASSIGFLSMLVNWKQCCKSSFLLWSRCPFPKLFWFSLFYIALFAVHCTMVGANINFVEDV